jgi:hypothetical protein
MAEKLQYELTLNTRATGTGARDTQTGLDRVTDAQKRLETTTGRTVTTGRSLETFLEDTRDKSKSATYAFYDLDKAMTATGNISNSVANGGVANVGKGVKNVGMIAGQAGFQIQDFAVQVSGGTSALTAFAQQAPQFLGIFGPTGAVAGALVAVGAIAAKVFFSMREEGVKALNVVKETAENVGEMAREDLDTARESIKEAAESAKMLKQEYGETKTASDSYASSALSNAEKIAAAHRTISEILGISIDKFRELNALEQGAADARNLTAQQAINAENERARKAKEAVTEASNQVSQTAQAFDMAKADLVIANAKLEALRAQKKELEDIVKSAPGVLDYLSAPDSNVLGDLLAKRAAAKTARKQLEDPNFEGPLKAAEAKVNALADQTGGPNAAFLKDLEAAEKKLAVAQKQREDTLSAVSIKISEIEQTQKADDLVAKADALKTSTDTFAQELKSSVEKVSASNSTAQATKDNILKIVSDGKITADETKALSQHLVDLTGQLQAGISSTDGNVSRLISVMFSWQQTAADHAKRIAELEKYRR